MFASKKSKKFWFKTNTYTYTLLYSQHLPKTKQKEKQKRKRPLTRKNSMSFTKRWFTKLNSIESRNRLLNLTAVIT